MALLKPMMNSFVLLILWKSPGQNPWKPFWQPHDAYFALTPITVNSWFILNEHVTVILTNDK